MNRGTSFMAGVVTALAITTAGLGVAVAANAEPRPQTNPNVIAEQFDVEIHWFTESDQTPCGDGEGVYGCATVDTPDVIYIRSGLPEDVTHSVILHEIGHVAQYRLGLPSDEAAATDFACALGATWNC